MAACRSIVVTDLFRGLGLLHLGLGLVPGLHQVRHHGGQDARLLLPAEEMHAHRRRRWCRLSSLVVKQMFLVMISEGYIDLKSSTHTQW